MTWQHYDSSGAGYRETNAQGESVGAAERDPMGADAELMKPFTWPPPTSSGKLEPYYGVPELNSATQGCELDRVPIPCDIFSSLMNNDALQVRYLLPMEEPVAPKRRKPGEKAPPPKVVLKTFVKDIISHGVGVFSVSTPRLRLDNEGWGWNWSEESFGHTQNPTPTRLQNAIDLARAALSRDSCKKLFGTGIDPVKLLNDLAIGTAGIGSIRTASLSPASTNAQTTGILGSRTITNAQGQQIRQSIFTGANITINSNSGAAFQAGYGSRFGVSDEINRASTLIHELGHAANIIFGQHSSGIMNDEGPLGGIASDMNSERVFKDCFEMYPSTYGGGQ